jgi:phosphate transport system substrate-binding protein
LKTKDIVVLSKKKTALMPLLVILSLAVIIIIVISIVLPPFFQPRPSPQPKPEEADKTRIATNYSNSTQTAAIVSPPPPPAPIDVVSTTTAFPFVQRWAAQYENQQLGSSGSVNIDYLDERQIKEVSRGGNGGRLAIVGTPDDNNNTVRIPVSAQAVAIVYNIPAFPDIPSGLRLNSTTLFLILNGTITRWNDAVIKDLNPSLNLPDERIIVVHDSDMENNTSSSLMLLNQYLSSRSLTWANDSIAVTGPAELAGMVRKTPYSVGYVDFSYAVQTRMTYAAIRDADGEYIVPSTQSIGRSVDAALEFHNSSIGQQPLSPPQQQEQIPTINASRLLNGSYPIVGLYYASLLLANDDDDKERKNAAILDFVQWIISDGGGQQTLLEVQYPPIYTGNEQLVTYAKVIMNTTSSTN